MFTHLKFPSMRSVAVVALLLTSSVLNAQGRGIEQFAWLAGCWEIDSGTRRVVERWSAPENGQMTGSSRTTMNGAPRASERLRLFFNGDTAVYEALPSGQALTQFKAATFTDREVVFANPAHDFPQRIVYTRVGQDSLVARIEGELGGRPRSIRYPFKKAACAPDAVPPA
jgi:hypothetical protein